MRIHQLRLCPKQFNHHYKTKIKKMQYDINRNMTIIGDFNLPLSVQKMRIYIQGQIA